MDTAARVLADSSGPNCVLNYMLNCVLPCLLQRALQTATASCNNSVKYVKRTATTNRHNKPPQRTATTNRTPRTTTHHNEPRLRKLTTTNYRYANPPQRTATAQTHSNEKPLHKLTACYCNFKTARAATDINGTGSQHHRRGAGDGADVALHGKQCRRCARNPIGRKGQGMAANLGN